MNIKELAQLLDGHEYGSDISHELINACKEHRLVIVRGASNDLIDLYGAIEDEQGCFGGSTLSFDKDGFIDTRGVAEENGYYSCIEHYLRSQRCCNIEAIWCAKDEPDWTYKLFAQDGTTEVDNNYFSTFSVLEGDTIYCRGLVFCLNDLGM